MIVYGKQPIFYLIEKHPSRIKRLYIAKELDKPLFNKLNRMSFELKRIPSDAATKMSRSQNHQGFLAEIEPYETKDLSNLSNYHNILILSSLTDMGNIGALVRSAYALEFDAVILCGINNANVENIIRTSSGALFDIDFILHHNINDLISRLKDVHFCVVGADMDGENIKETQIDSKVALILGNEGYGLTKRIISRLDKKVKIHMRDDFNSLNVSVAGAILMDRLR